MAGLQHERGIAAPPHAAAVAVAIDRVLVAEREAAAEVDARRAQCAERLAASRLEARRLLERAETLAQRIHARTERVAAARARALAGGRTPQPPSSRELRAAVERVAAELTGGGDG